MPLFPRGAVRRLRAFDPQSLGAWEFAALLLAILAAAAWLAARGLEAQVDLRQRMHVARQQAAAISPVAYRKPVPVTHRLLAPGAGGAVLALRVDSVADAGEAARLCRLVRSAAGATDSPPLRVLAFTADVPACARPLLADAMVDASRAEAVRREIRSARLVLVGADGRVRYNRRDVPDVAELRGTLSVFHSTP